MKRLKRLLLVATLPLTFAMPLAITGAASAAFLPSDKLLCDSNEDLRLVVPDAVFLPSCDLAITKQVNVNSGTYSDADTAAQAAQATVGDTVTFKITVSNNSTTGYNPYGTVTVQDNLPAGLTVSNVTASTGTYSDGNWTFALNHYNDNEQYVSNLPATLTITATVTTAGVVDNTATLTGYSSCEGECIDPPYVDSNAANNSNSAYVNVAAKVTTTSTTTTPAAPKTGYGVATSNVGATMAAFGAGTATMLAGAQALRIYAIRKSHNS